MNLKSILHNRILLICLFFSSFFLGSVLLYSLPPKIRISYGLSTTTDDGIKILFDMYQPNLIENKEKYNAIILGHGFMANKRFMKDYALELASSGFIAITLDFRGHGQSEGTFEQNRLIYDIYAIKKYLADKPEVDSTNLGFVGHHIYEELGNQIISNDTDFKCFVGISTYLTNDQGRYRVGNSTYPLNILILHSKFDEVISLEQIKRDMALRINESDLKTVDSNNIKLNQLYGGFREGNASKIYLGDLGTHITGYWDTNFIRETRDWIINTFPEEKPIDEDFYANLRALLFFFQMIGGIGLFFLIIEPICNVIFRSDKGIISALDMRDKEVKSFIFQTTLYSWFFGLGATILLYSSLLSVKLPLMNIIISLFFGMSVGILIMFWRFGKKRKTKLIGILKTPFMGTKLYKTKQILVGFILSILLFSILEFGIGMNYLGLKASIEKILWTPVCFLLLTLIFLIYGICFQLIFQEKFRKNFFGLLKTGICMFMTQILYFLIIMIILSVLGRNFYFIGIILPIMTPIVLLQCFISSITYQKSGNIITGIIINSFLLILIFTSISPLQSSLGFLNHLFSS